MQYNGQTYVASGLGTHPLYSYRQARATRYHRRYRRRRPPRHPAVVLGPALARSTGARVGQILTLSVAAGPTRVRVIGIDTVPTSNGDTAYFPLPVNSGAPGRRARHRKLDLAHHRQHRPRRH